MHWREVIRRPVITEKSNYMADMFGQYTFVVSDQANKVQVANAIELAWPDVKVAKVRMANMPAKRSRRLRKMVTRKSGYKKAIITLSEGSIDLFEGVS